MDIYEAMWYNVNDLYHRSKLYMETKERILILLQYLQSNSDDDRSVSAADIRRMFRNRGEGVSPPTLRGDIASLQKSGYEIDVREDNGIGTFYRFLDRDWSKPELQILVDAVSAAQFIPQARSEELIRKLASMAGPSHSEELVPQILISEHVKAKNKKMIYSVQAIRKAIERDRKITFRYLQFNLDKQQVPKHEGTPEENYVVSPYATVWNDDRYYLVGWSDKRNKVAVYRIDRMEVPKQLAKKRVPEPEGFDIRDYTDKVFRMYGGTEEEVTLRCKMEILDQVIDRFGDGIEIKPVNKDAFKVTVPVSISTTFYAWVFQFVGKMSIVAPENARVEYAGYLSEAIDDVLGE